MAQAIYELHEEPLLVTVPDGLAAEPGELGQRIRVELARAGDARAAAATILQLLWEQPRA